MRVAYLHTRQRADRWRSPLRSALEEASGLVVAMVPIDSAPHRLEADLGEGGRQTVALWLSEDVGPGRDDLLGPRISRTLAIPYVLLEPALDGSEPPNDSGLPGGFRHATAVLTSDRSRASRWANLGLPVRVHELPPVVDFGRVHSAQQSRSAHRAALASRLQLPTDLPWLVVDGTADGDDAIRCYALVARAVSRLVMEPWRLVVAVDGPRRAEACSAFRGLRSDRIRVWRDPSPEDRIRLYVSADLFLWPALGASGVLGILESQAAGVPVVSSRTPAAEDRVIDGTTGRLTEPGNAEAFANAVAFLLRHPDFRATFGGQARAAASQHHLGRATRHLEKILRDLVKR